MKAALARPSRNQPATGAIRCRRKFLRHFPKGFYDEKYIAWERGYKWAAHERWEELLNRTKLRGLIRGGQFTEIAARAMKVLAGTNLIFSFESMALRDAIRQRDGARSFGEGLYRFIYGTGKTSSKFENWCDVIASLPKKQSRVLTYPIATVFGFLARPDMHVFLKPIVTRTAAARYGFDFDYRSRPSWTTYESLLKFASTIEADLADLRPRDMIDIQSFIWVNGSNEY